MNRIVVLWAVSGIALASSWATPGQAALVSYWNLDDQADDQVGANHLTATGDATFTPSLHPGLGQAGLFDGAADGFIRSGYVPVMSDDITIVAWVYAESLPTFASILKNWGDLGGQFHFGAGDWDNDTLQVHSPAGPITDSEDLPTGQWVHVAWVLDSAAGENSLYINGLLAHGPQPYAGTLGLGGGDPSLGLGIKPNSAGTEPSGGAPGSWDGMIDEVGIFSSALSPAILQKIVADAQQGIPLNQSIVPEPSTFVTLLIGLAGTVAVARRRATC